MTSTARPIFRLLDPTWRSHVLFPRQPRAPRFGRRTLGAVIRRRRRIAAPALSGSVLSLLLPASSARRGEGGFGDPSTLLASGIDHLHPAWLARRDTELPPLRKAEQHGRRV